MAAARDVTRVLFVVPPLAGHINPTVPLATELQRRGHEVLWTGLPGDVPRLLPPGSPFVAAAPPDVDGNTHRVAERANNLRGAAALKFLWEDVLLPLARWMAPGVEDVVRDYGPDVVVSDQQALAGAIVGTKLGLTWATSATTSAEFAHPLRALPMVKQWLDDALLEVQVDCGIPADVAAGNDLMVSPHCVLAYTTPALVGAGPFPDQVHFVGPSIADRPEPSDFPWDWLRPDVPHVLVSLGTLNAVAGERFFGCAVEALGDADLQAVLVAPPELVPDPPANVLVRPRVPQLSLLHHIDAVVSHAGHNTVCESLARGLPLVLAPIRDDQPIVADQVVQAGAGLRVKFSRVRPAELRDAVQRVLTDPAIRGAARDVQASFAAAGGAVAAADCIEQLAERS